MSTPTLLRSTKGLLATVACALLMSSCGDVASNGSGPAFLIMESLRSASGGQSLDSDVVSAAGLAVIDLGTAQIRVQPKNITGVTGPTAFSDVTLSSYRVRFRRTDGQNREGIDVPYGFDGGVTMTIPTGNSAAVNFDLVRQSSKLEPPLRTLVGGGGLIVIATIAEVTFYGRDQAGNEVSVTGSMDVRFGDF